MSWGHPEREAALAAALQALQAEKAERGEEAWWPTSLEDWEEVAKALLRPKLRHLFTELTYGKNFVTILESGTAGNLLKNKWQSMAKAFKDSTQAPAEGSPRYLWHKYSVQRMYLTHTQTLANRQLQAKLQKQEAKLGAARRKEQAKRQAQNFQGRGAPTAEVQDLCSSDDEDSGGGHSDGDGDGDGSNPEAAAGKEKAAPRKVKEAKKEGKKPHVAAQAALDVKLFKSLDSMAQGFKEQTAVQERSLEQNLRLHKQNLEQNDRHRAEKRADRAAERRELAEAQRKDRELKLKLQEREHALEREKQKHEEKMLRLKIELARASSKGRKGDSSSEED